MAYTIAAGWLLLCPLVALLFAALGRGGLEEDRVRGYVTDGRDARPVDSGGTLPPLRPTDALDAASAGRR